MSNKNNRPSSRVADESNNETSENNSELSFVGSFISGLIVFTFLGAVHYIKGIDLNKVISLPDFSPIINSPSPPPNQKPEPFIPPPENRDKTKAKAAEQITVLVQKAVRSDSSSQTLASVAFKSANEENDKRGNLFSPGEIKIIADYAAISARSEHYLVMKEIKASAQNPLVGIRESGRYYERLVSIARGIANEENDKRGNLFTPEQIEIIAKYATMLALYEFN